MFEKAIFIQMYVFECNILVCIEDNYNVIGVCKYNTYNVCVCICIYRCVNMLFIHVQCTLYTYVYVCMCIYVYVSGHMYMCICVYVCVCLRLTLINKTLPYKTFHHIYYINKISQENRLFTIVYIPSLINNAMHCIHMIYLISDHVTSYSICIAPYFHNI